MKRARFFGALLALAALVACNDSGLPPGGTYNVVSGVVLDAATNQPVSGAAVTIDTVLKQQTGPDGKFSFSQVPVGDVDLEVQASGYKTYTSASRLDPDKPLTLTVTLSH